MGDKKQKIGRHPHHIQSATKTGEMKNYRLQEEVKTQKKTMYTGIHTTACKNVYPRNKYKIKPMAQRPCKKNKGSVIIAEDFIEKLNGQQGKGNTTSSKQEWKVHDTNPTNHRNVHTQEVWE